MYSKQLDHAYHRSRIDAHITGNVCLVAIVAVLALTIGDQFKPFRFGASMFEPVRLVWVEGGNEWILEETLRNTNNFPPADNKGPVDIKELYPISLSIMLVLGTLAIAYFIYTCARRQTQLMSATASGEAERPYGRMWEEIRVTFWALNVVLVFILFFFLS